MCPVGWFPQLHDQTMMADDSQSSIVAVASVAATVLHPPLVSLSFLAYKPMRNPLHNPLEHAACSQQLWSILSSLAGKLPSMQPLKTLPAFFNAEDIEVQYLGTDLACRSCLVTMLAGPASNTGAHLT